MGHRPQWPGHRADRTAGRRRATRLDQIMGEVWREQKSVKAARRVPNPVLQERQRRRR